eukprot:6513127-Ditylum_brightwellii.AAC.2
MCSLSEVHKTYSALLTTFMQQYKTALDSLKTVSPTDLFKKSSYSITKKWHINHHNTGSPLIQIQGKK